MLISRKVLKQVAEGVWLRLGGAHATRELRGIRFPAPQSERERLLFLLEIAERSKGFGSRGAWPLMMLPRKFQGPPVDDGEGEQPEPKGRLVLLLLLAVLIPILGHFFVKRALADVVSRRVIRWARTGRLSSWLMRFLYGHAMVFIALFFFVAVPGLMIAALMQVVVTVKTGFEAGIAIAVVALPSFFAFMIVVMIQVLPVAGIFKRAAKKVAQHADQRLCNLPEPAEAPPIRVLDLPLLGQDPAPETRWVRLEVGAEEVAEAPKRGRALLQSLRRLRFPAVALDRLLPVTGGILLGLVVAHLGMTLLCVFGAGAMNAASWWLKGKGVLLAFVRVVFVACMAVHVAAAVRFWLARRGQETGEPVPVLAWSGPLLGLVVVVHVLHLGTGTLHPSFSADVFSNLVIGVRSIPVAVLYLAGCYLLALHLRWALHRLLPRLGWDDPASQQHRRWVAVGAAAAIASLFATVPIMAVSGLIAAG